MKLKKHKDTIFKSFRDNKKEMKRQDYCMERDAKWAEYWNSPEAIEGRRQWRKQAEWAASCRLGGFGDFCGDNTVLLELHRQLFFEEWERNHPI